MGPHGMATPQPGAHAQQPVTLTPTANANWQLLPLCDGWQPHAARWDALNQRLWGGHPLLSAIVVGELLAHYGSGREVLAELRDHDGQSLAMCVLEPSSIWRWQSFLPAQTQLALQLMDDLGNARGLLRALPWHVLQLDLLCQDPHLTQWTAEPEPHSHLMLHARTVHVDLLDGWDAYWQDRSPNLRANMRRYLNRVQSDGKTLAFECHAAPEAVAAAVHRYGDLELRGWKAQEGTALKSSAAQFDHYLNVMARSAAHGAARVYELRIDGELVASRLTLMSGSTLVILKTTYDETMSRYAPGRLHLLHLLQHACAAKELARVEFYTNANADTLAWASDSRWITHVTLERSALTSLLISTLRFGRHAAQAERTDDDDGWALHHVARMEELPIEAQSLLARVGEPGAHPDGPQASGARRYYWLAKGDQVQAVLPVEVDRRWGVEALRSADPHPGPAVPALAMADPEDPTAVRHLLAQLLRSRPRVACLSLAPLAPEAGETRAWASALSALALPTVCHALPGSERAGRERRFEDALAAHRPRLQDRLTQAQAQLQALGVRIEVLVDSLEGKPGMTRIAPWLGGEAAASLGPGQRLAVAYQEGAPVAAQRVNVQQRVAKLHPVDGPDGSSAAPIRLCLSAALLQHVWDHDGIERIAFLGAAGADWEPWPAPPSDRWRLVSHNPSTLWGCAALLRAAIAPAPPARPQATAGRNPELSS